MKRKIIGVLLMLFTLISCAQENRTVLGMENYKSRKRVVNWMPYLTKEGKFIYLDKEMRPQLADSYTRAQPFIPTGFAFVGDEEGRTALIDTYGNLVVGYLPDEMELKIVGNLTLLLKVREYEKKMMPWNWEWNIMGGDIQKKQTYHQVEILVLETQQHLFSADVPYMDDNYNIDTYMLDAEHFVMNDILYQIQGEKIKTLRSKISTVLEGGRYLPEATTSFEMYAVKQKAPLYSSLKGTDKVEFLVNQKTIVLDSINHDRYVPEVPKLLTDAKSGDIFPYPQYDKALPKEIKNATAEQLDFLDKTSLIYSVNNSPYFILGCFNYDNAVWAFDWLYLDAEGNLHTEIKVNDFFIRDQMGYLVWPDKSMILSKEALGQGMKFGKISYVYGSETLYIVSTQIEEQTPKKGIWNTKNKAWELEPTYDAIEMLNGVDLLFALKKEADGKYAVYNHKEKKNLTPAKYDSVSGNGHVDLKSETGTVQSYYVDLTTGEEYKE